MMRFRSLPFQCYERLRLNLYSLILMMALRTGAIASAAPPQICQLLPPATPARVRKGDDDIHALLFAPHATPPDAISAEFSGRLSEAREHTSAAPRRER